MLQTLSISEARQSLPALLKAIQEKPDCEFMIRVHGQPVALLSAVKMVPKTGKAVAALLNVMEAKVKKSDKTSKSRSRTAVHSENFKDFLYGK